MTQRTRTNAKKAGIKTVIEYVWWCQKCITIDIGSSKAPVCRCKKKMERIGWFEKVVT